MSFLSSDIKIDQVLVTQAAATSAVATSIVDMADYDGVIFIASIGTAAADNIVKLQQSASNDTAGMSDLAGTALASDATSKCYVTDLQRPAKRYVRMSIARGTSTTVEAVWAIRYNARSLPVTNITSNQLVERTLTPAEGTA